jgi:SAM-dependent methyltransferase
MSVFGNYFENVEAFFFNREVDHITNCYLCGKHHEKTYQRLYQNLYQCEGCGFAWLANRPKLEVLDEFYRQSAAMSDWAKIKSGSIDINRQKTKYKFFYDQITYRGLDSVLDVGCGSGKFLSALPEDCDGLGVEPNKDSAATCDSPVVDSINKVTGKFDMLTYMGVLEHLVDPIQTMKEYDPFLLDNGFVGVCVPNIESLAFKVLREKNCSICPQHLYYYSIDSLNELMSKAGYDIITYTTVEPELQPIIKMEKYGEPYLDTGWEYKHETYTEQGILEKNQGAKILALYLKRIPNEQQTHCNHSCKGRVKVNTPQEPNKTS